MDDMTPQPIKPYFLWVKPVLPLVYDEALSYLETLGQVVVKLNEVISWANDYTDTLYAYVDQKAKENLEALTAELEAYKLTIETQLQNLDNKVSGFQDQLNSTLTTVNALISQFQTDINNQLAGFQLQYKADINQFKNQTTQQLEEQNARVQAAILENTIYVNAQISTLTSLVNLKAQENKDYVDSEIQKLKDSLPDLNSINVIYPGNSVLMSIQEAVDLLYHDLLFFSLTAAEYDSLQLTADQYDTFLNSEPLTAEQYDLWGKYYLAHFMQGGGASLPTPTDTSKYYFLMYSPTSNSWEPVLYNTTNRTNSDGLTVRVMRALDGRDTGAPSQSQSAYGEVFTYLPPYIGQEGQVLTFKSGGGVEWKTPSGGSGTPGPAGKSAYEIAVDEGYTGSVTDWLESLKGAKGDAGAVFTPSVSPDGMLSWTNNGELTNPTPVNIKGPQGNPGKDAEFPAIQTKSSLQFLGVLENTTTASWITPNELRTPPSTVYVLGGAYSDYVGYNYFPTLLPPTDGNEGDVFTRTELGGEWQTPSGGSAIPKGSIMMWYGDADQIPQGWVLCDGNNGTPNLQGRFILGAGDLYALGDMGGETEHILNIKEMAPHTHGYSEILTKMVQSDTGVGDDVEVINDIRSSQTGISGSASPHNNMPPYYALYYIMKT